jgi:hypothetical protein
VLFEQRFGPGIAEGSITTTFRRWKRRQAVAGHRYRTVAGMIEVDSVDVVDESTITDAEARRAGYLSRYALIADLRGTHDLSIYRVRFHHVGGADPREELARRAELSDEEVAELDRRLDRLDRASVLGAWTTAVLFEIATCPAARAGDLATSLGQERLGFKANVRKLKGLGLTTSLEVGYRLSPRGEAYMRLTRRGQAHGG